ncbi:hypothetical protein M501DRAFT_943194 [Patellaria atrata CBS 101060]|uniref:Rhodopsin domain-containing protein n=1 Tax=Patellaria atrata CBS 101060 TaxID=1346257 RepID=A0A9P4S465_9PEZI|nr:hypothetical protein M501DRAFT_943194 [Patellaria atrata CBS 101060]
MARYPLQDTCLAVICATPVMAAAFVCLRFYARYKMRTRISWDDYLVAFASILSLAIVGPSYKHVIMWHVGIHIYDVDQYRLEPNYDDYFPVILSFNLLNILILPIVKASIIMLLLRVSTIIPRIRLALYGVLTFTLGACIIPWGMFVFMCPPRTGNNWAPRTFGGLKCIDRPTQGELLIFVTCANLLTDCLIFPIPFLIMRRVMSASFRARLVVTLLFASSLAVTAIGAAKIYLQYRDRLFRQYKADWTYSIDYCISHIENNVAIMVACVPTLRGLVARWASNVREATVDLEIRGFTITRRSSSGSAGPPRGPLSPPTSPRVVGVKSEDFGVVRVTTEVTVTRFPERTCSVSSYDDLSSNDGTILAKHDSTAKLIEETISITSLPKCQLR